MPESASRAVPAGRGVLGLPRVAEAVCGRDFLASQAVYATFATTETNRERIHHEQLASEAVTTVSNELPGRNPCVSESPACPCDGGCGAFFRAIRPGRPAAAVWPAH